MSLQVVIYNAAIVLHNGEGKLSIFTSCWNPTDWGLAPTDKCLSRLDSIACQLAMIIEQIVYAHTQQ